MTLVAGIDLSLTSTGLAIIGPTKDRPNATFHTIASTGRRGDTWPQRAARLHQLRHQLMQLVPADTALVALEGPAFGVKTQAGQHDRAWYWGKIYDALTHRRIPIVVVPPQTRAKYATGKGNSGKVDVAIAVSRMWPDVDVRGDDQADALILASIAAHHLRMPVPYTILERHKLTLSAIEWPQISSDTE